MMKTRDTVPVATVAYGRAYCIFRHLKIKGIPTAIHSTVVEKHRVFEVRVLSNDVSKAKRLIKKLSPGACPRG